MSQQGIFSIASDAQPAQANGGGAASPFTAVTSGGDQSAQQQSPFASASPSPFQQVTRESGQDDGAQRGGIPQPRPEGQPPAMKLAG